MSFFKSVWVILERNSCRCLGVLGSCRYCRVSWDDVGEDSLCDCWLAIFEGFLIDFFE